MCRFVSMELKEILHDPIILILVCLTSFTLGIIVGFKIMDFVDREVKNQIKNIKK